MGGSDRQPVHDLVQFNGDVHGLTTVWYNNTYMNAISNFNNKAGILEEKNECFNIPSNTTSTFTEFLNFQKGGY